MEAIILAGGLGTRLRPIVTDVPKPMAPVHGYPFLQYQIDYWIGQGVRRFVLSVGHRAEQILEYFGDRMGTAQISYAIERKPLGTGGGIRLAASLLKESGPCLILNGDTYVPVDLKKIWAFHKSRRADLTLSLLRVNAADRYHGVQVDPMGRVKTFQPADSALQKTCLINAGVYLAEPAALKSFGKPSHPISFENEVLPKFIADEKRVFGNETDGPFIDIGIPEDYRRAASVLEPVFLNTRRLKNAS
jgi:D-glycero-alpha-D-manno-heptose 1-phosphate guanylyltransferase